MRKNIVELGVALFGLLGLVNTSQAALNDLGNGLVNDTTQNITWMKDANLVKTSCDADNALWQAFDPTTVTPNSGRTKAQICTDNGILNWFEAEAWMAVLNTQSYLGHNDWRQPLTPQPDLTCERVFGAGNYHSYNCRGSELGHLFNASAPAGLGNPNDAGTGTGLDGSSGTVGTECAPICFTQTGPFDNAQSFAYWSGSEFAPNPDLAWDFRSLSGIQFIDGKDFNNFFVWPVRSGQSVVAPVTPQNVPTLSIWGLGIMSLLLAFVARRKAR